MHIELDLKGRGLSLLAFVLSFCCLVYLYSAVPALFTIALSAVIWLLYRPVAETELPRKALAYGVFLLRPC
jgi:hypothetical protein